MGLVLKVTPSNIIRLWFGEDTPLRQYRIQMNPQLWAACERVSQQFTAPSGAADPEHYRRVDLTAFASAVQQELGQTNPISTVTSNIPQLTADCA